MPTVRPVTDDVERLAREVWRINITSGLFQRRIAWDGSTLGQLAKAAGATEAQVMAWINGQAQPTTGQALAVLDALPLPAVSLANGNGHAVSSANGVAK